MALENLIGRINEEAEKELEEIIGKAQREAEAIVKKEKEKGEMEAEKIRARGKRDAERAREKIFALYNRKARMEIANAKEEIIERCFEKIRNKLGSMDGKEYEKVMEKMAKETVKGMKEFYIIGTRKEDKKIADKLNAEIKEMRKGIGGIIIKTEDGSKEIDLTFDFLLERKREEIRIKIARELFGEND